MAKISDLRLRQDTKKNWQKSGLQDAELTMLKGPPFISDNVPGKKTKKKKTSKKNS